MSEKNTNANNYIGYEYKIVTVRKEMESLWRDSMTNFGWQLEKHEAATVKHVGGPLRVMLVPLALIPDSPFGKMIRDHKSGTHVELTFKRDKKILHKAELTCLQTQYESQTKVIDSLEDSKDTTAGLTAFCTGLLGTMLLGIATFCYLVAMIMLCVVMAIPGFACWIAAYYIHQSIKSSKTEKVGPEIEKQYGGIYDACQKANGILYSSAEHLSEKFRRAAQ